MALAPVILFAYNRPAHLKETLQSLQQNSLSAATHLYVYIDGPKAGATPDEIEKTAQVKRVVREEKWCGEVTVVEAQSNKGLAASVTAGVSELVNRYGKVVVLEDDLLSDTCFLEFMNAALDKYEATEEVISISGYIYPVEGALPENLFLKGADCWGWATWKRGWALLEQDPEKLLKQLQAEKKEAEFNFNNTYPYVQMLKDRIEGKNNSWAVLWYASAFLKNKLTLYPGHSLIRNIGADGSGTHTGDSDAWKTQLKHERVKVLDIEVKENKDAKRKIEAYFGKIMGTAKKSFAEKLKNKFWPFN